MACPDNSRFAAWLSGGDDAALDEHVPRCALCQDRAARLSIDESVVRSSLSLTAEDLTFLRSVDLASSVLARIESAPRPSRVWPVLLITAALSVLVLWQIAGPAFSRVASLLARVGLVGVTLDLLASAVLAGASLVIGVASSPAASASPTIAGVIALAAWLWIQRGLVTPATRRA